MPSTSTMAKAVVDAPGQRQAAIHEHQRLGQLAANSVIVVRIRHAQAHVDPLAVPSGFGGDLVEIALLAGNLPVEPVFIALAADVGRARKRAVAPAMLGIALGAAPIGKVIETTAPQSPASVS
jgi:hypothetical protein